MTEEHDPSSPIDDEIDPGSGAGSTPDPTFSSDFPIAAFHSGGLLWAVNQFLLWPLGLALVVTLAKDEGMPPDYKPGLRVGHWTFADGHVETIEGASESDDEWGDRWEAFRVFCANRLELMPYEERVAAEVRLDFFLHQGRPQARWVP